MTRKKEHRGPRIADTLGSKEIDALTERLDAMRAEMDAIAALLEQTRKRHAQDAAQQEKKPAKKKGS